jgi:cyclopropane-fatty-acyl-phospholipid synthase
MSQSDDTCAANTNMSAAARIPLADVRSRLFDRLLPQLAAGRLRIVLPGGQTIERAGREPGPDATVILNRWRALRRLAAGGDVGFAEAWIDGDWTSPDLTAVVRLGICNSQGFDSALRGSAAMRFANRLRHRMRANSKKRSPRNIEAHYDLGNDFYRLWLDPAMLYSSALWDGMTENLEQAQRKKVERICELLRLSGGEKVLEIGSGWGSLAARLASEPQTHVTGITLSPSQLAWAGRELEARGLANKVDLRLQDYRDVEGKFDRIVSIEMFEAVGEAYWPSYFATLARSLSQNGRAVLQVITIAEDRFDAYRNEADFIQKHVFPGGFLPSKTALRESIEQAGLRLTASETFGASYARTLVEWRRHFNAHWDEIARQGFDERFRRLWEYYFCYCEAGFLEGTVDVGLYTIEHPSQVC